MKLQTLNQTQRAYTRKRIAELRHKKLNEVEINFKILSKKLTHEEQLDLVNKKKVKLKTSVKQARYNSDYSLDDIFDIKHPTPTKAQNVKYGRLKKQIQKKCDDATDQVMLSMDATGALLIIREIEKISTEI